MHIISVRFLLVAALTAVGPASGYAIESDPGFPWALEGKASDVKSPWTVDLSSGNSITFDGGKTVIRANRNTYAHVQRALNVRAGFRVTASINSPPCGLSAPSLFLYWSPQDYVQVGHISRHDLYHLHGPAVYAVLVQGGKETEYRLTTTTGEEFRYNPGHGGLDQLPIEALQHRVAVALGNDTFYFQISPDGTKWDTELKLPRSAAFASAPKLLIVGKGLSGGDSGTASDMNNNARDPGEMITAEIQNVTVTSVSEADLQASPISPEHYLDLAGKRVLDAPGDPTFEMIQDEHPELMYSREVVGVKDHAYEFAVLSNCAISPGAGAMWFEVGERNSRFGLEPFATRQLDEGWIPTVTAAWERDGLRWEQTAFGWSQGMTTSAPLHCYIRLSVRNAGSAAATTSATLAGDRVTTPLLQWQVGELKPGESKSRDYRVEHRGDAPLRPEVIEASEFDSRRAETADWWRKELARGMQISIPEQRIMDAWKAWLAYTYINVDQVQDRFEFRDGGGGFYEAVYGFSAAQGIGVLDMLNRNDDARRYLESMTKMGAPDGSFIINFGIPDHGALMNALCSHYEMTGDVAWMKSMAPTLVKMSKWITTTRKTQRDAQETTSPVYGMIKGRPYCDHPEPGYYIISDVFLITGMQRTAQALKHLGMNDDAEWIAREAEAYNADLQRVMERSVFTVENHKLLPLFPETRELLRASRWFAYNYYGLCVGSLLESGGDVVKPDSAYSDMIVRAMEERGALSTGVCKFWGGIDHAYTSGYWYDRLMKGEPEKAILGLYSSMAFGISRNTHSAVEVTFHKEGKNFPTLPHSYSNLQQLRLVRNLLVLEQGTTLTLGAGITRHWLASGKPVGAKDAGTAFGTVTYHMTLSGDRKSARVEVAPPQRSGPKALRVWLRHPDGAKIAEVRAGGEQIKRAMIGNEHFEVPCPTDHVVYEVDFASSR